MFLVSVFFLCICTILVNLIKDGLTTWVPSILKDEYSMSDSISILLTLLLPMIAIFGNGVALFIHNRIPDYVSHCFISFLAIGLFVLFIILGIKIKVMFMLLFGLIVVALAAANLNSLITSIFPLFMRSRIDSGTYAGVLNGFSYLGSTISAYGLGVIAEHFGWLSVFWFFLEVCCVVYMLRLIYTFVKKKYNCQIYEKGL